MMIHFVILPHCHVRLLFRSRTRRSLSVATVTTYEKCSLEIFQFLMERFISTCQKKRSQSHINEYYICFIVGHWLAHFHSPNVQVCFVFLKQMTISQNGAKKKRTANLNSFYCEKFSPFRPFIIRGVFVR